MGAERLNNQLDRVFNILSSFIDGKTLDRGQNYVRFVSRGNTYVLEKISNQMNLWRSNALFTSGCRSYSLDEIYNGVDFVEKVLADINNL